MGERLVGLRHLVDVVPLADRVALALESFENLDGQRFFHRHSLAVVGVSDEHGKVRIPAGAAPLRLGDKVMLIPGHCDPTVNLHDWYVAVRGGRVESLWPISARGASS